MSETSAQTGMPARLLPVLTLMIFVVMADGRVMAATLPDIATDLGTTVAAVGLAITAYLVAYGVFQLGYGPIADRIRAPRSRCSPSRSSSAARRERRCSADCWTCPATALSCWPAGSSCWSWPSLRRG